MGKTAIRIVAPASLEEGYRFDVMLDGQPFTVTVPAGGVEEGEEFDIPYPVDADEEDGSIKSDAETFPVHPSGSQGDGDEDDNNNGMEDHKSPSPKGQWRTSLCSCCDVLMQATFWMAICCPPVLIAQLLTRMKLSWTGRTIPVNNSSTVRQQEYSLTYNKILLSFIAVLLVGQFLPIVGLFFVLTYLVAVLIVVGSNLRRQMRTRYKIPTSTGLPYAMDDLLCMCCCPFCSAIQMARHTHNDKEYPGYCCTTTGLESGAPEIV